MELLILLFKTFCLVAFVDLLSIKFDWMDKLSKISMKVENRKIYELLNCLFCLRFHAGIICMCFLLFLQWTRMEIIAIPLMVSGFFKIVKYDN